LRKNQIRCRRTKKNSGINTKKNENKAKKIEEYSTRKENEEEKSLKFTYPWWKRCVTES